MGCFNTTTRQSLRTTARHLCWLLVAMVVWTAASIDSSAFAETCGHYLFRNGHPVGADNAMVTGTFDSGSDLGVALIPADSPWSPAPCDGPGCRQNSIPLSAPPATPVTSAASEFAALVQLLNVCDGAAQTHALPVSEDGHFFLSQPVFRPPICEG